MSKQQPAQPSSKMRVNNLQDLSRLLALFPAEPEAETPVSPGPQEKKAIYNEYRNSTYQIVSLTAYLIGVPREHFGNGDAPLSESIYLETDRNRTARLIRELCRVRTAFEKNYKAIHTAFRTTMSNIGSLPEWIPQDAVSFIADCGIRLYKTKPDIDEYLIMLNSELSNRISGVASLYPEWIRWDYVKPLFLMPSGMKKEGIKAAGFIYNQDRNRYPFHCWINWDAVSTGADSKGNILYNDEKFVTLLYERHEDRFENLSLVRDAGNQTMRNLTSLLERSRKCVIVVDCENSDAVKLAAALSSLPSDQAGKIAKILLFDSEYTTDQWKTLVDSTLHVAINGDSELILEHIVVPRLNQNKSQVDMTLAVRTSREVYTAGVDSVILVSSDSDYWAMISQLDGVRFLVMLEKVKTGTAILDTLARHEIPFCFIDDFCTAASYSIKTSTLLGSIQARIDQVLSGAGGKAFNVREMMEDSLQNSWIYMTEKEKEAFYTRYLLHMKLNVDAEGNVSVTLG